LADCDVKDMTNHESAEQAAGKRSERKKNEKNKNIARGFSIVFVIWCIGVSWFFLPGFRDSVQDGLNGINALFAEAPEPEPIVEMQLETAEEPFVEQSEILVDDAEAVPESGYIADETSYKSENVEISIETIAENNKTYYVADIKIKNPEDILTGVFRVSDGVTKGDVVETAVQNNAVLAINTDYYTYRNSGAIIRNGEVKVNDPWGDTLCIFDDGSMQSFAAAEYDAYELQALGVVQSFTFGPLMIKDGEYVIDNLDGSGLKEARHPRTGIGYYEPGHFIFVAVDGRKEGYSEGMSIPELAKVFYDRGCVLAYNLDGGGSTTMAFMGELMNRPEGKTTHLRNVDGILYIKDDVYESPVIKE